MWHRASRCLHIPEGSNHRTETGQTQPISMHVQPRLEAKGTGLAVEFSMGAKISRQRVMQVSWTIGIDRLISLLRAIAHPCQIVIGKSGHELLADNRLDGG